MKVLQMRLVTAGIAAVLLVCSATFAQSVPATSPAKAVGWRNDGSGRYPDANPPLSWGRVAKSVKDLSAQSGKPKDDSLPAKESAIPDGVIRQWLVLAPIPVPEDKKVEDMLLEAKDLSPDADDKTGDLPAGRSPATAMATSAAAGDPPAPARAAAGEGLKWKPVNLESNCMDLCAITGIAPNQKGYMAYAHAYIYSPSGQTVVYNFQFQGQGTARIWLNGVSIFDAGKNLDVGSGTRLGLPLKKGWNRLLVLNARTIATRRSWWFMGTLYGDLTSEYETHGIVWMTPIPTSGSSAPVSMGDRLFFTGETGSVYCVNKADGKILWVHSLNYHDFAMADDRKANPEIFAELDVLAESLKKLDEADSVMPYKAPAFEKDLRVVMEPQINKGMEKVSKERFNHAGTWGAVAGFTPITPVTDGQRVYALFGTGIVACYDRDGNCIWKRLLKHTMIEHGYATSPLLVDGKLVIYTDDFVVLDPKTGDVVVERPHLKSPNATNQFFGTGCVLSAGDVKVGYFNDNEFVRLSDGKTLPVSEEAPKTLKGGFLATPVVEDGVAYSITSNEGGVISFKLPALQGDKAAPEIVQTVPFNTDKFPYFYENFYCASPLLHEGLLYCLNDFGVLTVVDMAKGEVLYQRHLDLDIFMPYNGTPLQGGAGSSPTLAGKYIYIWGNQGTCLVLEPGRTFKQAARNRVENSAGTNYRPRQEATMTNPIFEGDRMYYRGEFAIYCIGPK